MALVPLFVVLDGASARHAIAAGVAYAAAAMGLEAVPWLGPALGRYFHLEPARAYAVALGVATAVAVAHGAILGIVLALQPRTGGPWRVAWYGATWASWEALRTIAPPYFPVASIAASQADAPAVLQLASVTGVAGVTALVVATNAALATLLDRTLPRAQRIAPLAACTALAGAATVWGEARLQSARPSPDGPRVVAVDIGATAVGESTLDAYIAATPAWNDEPRPDLILWPESALTVDLERDRAAWRRISAFVAERDVTLLTGGVTLALAAGNRTERFNSVIVLRPRHGMRYYHKQWTVPVAETWPALLGAPPAWLEPVNAGVEHAVFEEAGTSVAPLICFEIADPHAARRAVALGARAIVNPTNDAWFPAGTAPHSFWARIRAIETGLPVVRVANAGITAVIDPLGTLAAAAERRGRLRILDTTVPSPLRTIYARMGDGLLTACSLVVAAGILARIASIRGARTWSRTSPP